MHILCTITLTWRAENPSSPEPDFVGDSDSDEVALSTPMSLSLKNKKAPKQEKKSAHGTVYPSDVWFHIAKYIAPEDLSRFALICKDAYRVILSVQFWKQLCQR